MAERRNVRERRDAEGGRRHLSGRASHPGRGNPDPARCPTPSRRSEFPRDSRSIRTRPGGSERTEEPFGGAYHSGTGRTHGTGGDHRTWRARRRGRDRRLVRAPLAPRPEGRVDARGDGPARVPPREAADLPADPRHRREPAAGRRDRLGPRARRGPSGLARHPGGRSLSRGRGDRRRGAHLARAPAPASHQCGARDDAGPGAADPREPRVRGVRGARHGRPRRRVARLGPTTPAPRSIPQERRPRAGACSCAAASRRRPRRSPGGR